MKRVVTVIGVILLIVAVPLSVLLVMRNQELRKKAAPATTLSLSPNTVSSSVGEEFMLEVRMDTAENQIVAVELHLTYDDTKLQADWIHNGTMFPNILTSGTVGGGNISIALGATNTTTPITGTGTVATIKFHALEATASPVSVRFGQNTFIGALNESTTNALSSSIPATISITGGGTSTGSTTTILPTPTVAAATTTTTTTTTFSNTDTSATRSASLTPTPTGDGLTDTEASPSAVTITNPTHNESVSTELPQIEGKAPPGSTVTIVIHSTTQITATVVADANGNWTYDVTDPLEAGPHTINVAAQNPTTGTTSTATLAFVVSNGTENGSAGTAIPATGAVENTFIFLATGLLFVIAGAIIPAVRRRS